MQILIDLIKDLIERVMDEAATVAESKNRSTIYAAEIKTGAGLALQTRIDGRISSPMGRSMIHFAALRFNEYCEYRTWERLQAEAIALGGPATDPPDRPCPSPLRLRLIEGRFVPDHLEHVRGVRGIRPLNWEEFPAPFP